MPACSWAISARAERRARSSDAAAEKALRERVDSGEPVRLQVDMGFLPCFDFGGQDYHFGGRLVAACGRDQASGDYLVADRVAELRRVPAARLAAARSSRFKPFPPGRAWWSFGFEGFRLPRPEDLSRAIANQCELMLDPPIANLGFKGIA
jgi:hypothetical protein